MVKRNRNQLIYANNMPDKWLRTAVAVAEPDRAGALMRSWQASQRMPVAADATPGAKKPH
jgi:hypothetical protein